MGRSISEKEGAAFSEAQWQELERQRNIFNYMMASLPVPSELLTPFSKNPSHTNNQEGDQDEAMGSSLTLSMAGGGGMEEAEGRNQHQWISHEGPSWLCSTTPGGPLAEELCLGVSNNPSTSTTTSLSMENRFSSFS